MQRSVWNINIRSHPLIPLSLFSTPNPSTTALEDSGRPTSRGPEVEEDDMQGEEILLSSPCKCAAFVVFLLWARYPFSSFLCNRAMGNKECNVSRSHRFLIVPTVQNRKWLNGTSQRETWNRLGLKDSFWWVVGRRVAHYYDKVVGRNMEIKFLRLLRRSPRRSWRQSASLSRKRLLKQCLGPCIIVLVRFLFRRETTCSKMSAQPPQTD